MNLKALLGLRPKTETAEALAAAQTKTETALAAARSRIASIEARRGEMLLDGDANAVEASERDLAEARAEAERLASLLPVLRQRADNARRAEERATAEQHLNECEAACAKAAELIQTEYPALASRIGEILDMERTAHRGVQAARAAVAKLGEDARMPQEPVQRYWRGIMPIPLCDRVTLPAAENSDATPFWPPVEPKLVMSVRPTTATPRAA